MKILNKSTNAVVYDNQMGLSDDGTPTTALGGGSIVIHSSGGAGQAALLPTGPTTFDYSLAQNRPNPFSVSTELQFSLRERSDVSIAIYDLAGREVLRLVNGELDAGLHSTAWTGRDGSGNAVQKGVYFVRMTTTALRDGTHFTTTRRMVVL
jgi:hypothetical protein